MNTFVTKKQDITYFYMLQQQESSRRRAPILRLKRPLSSEESNTRRKRQSSQQKNHSILPFIVVFFTLLLAISLCLAYLTTFSNGQPSPVSNHSINQQQRHVQKRNEQKQLLEANDNNDKILALVYPPGLIGGYRNQVIRILAFCIHAMKNNINKLLLPSILWATQIEINGKETWVPIPHDLLFDVEHWNEQQTLPTLVEYAEMKRSNHHHQNGYDCWSLLDSKAKQNISYYDLLTQQVLKRGFLTPIANISIQFATRQQVGNPRKLDLLPNVEHCKKPLPYGAGKGAGRLWNDYIAMQNKQTKVPFQADAKLLNALRPKQVWRDLAMSCVQQYAATEYVALHARIELEMMDHVCGRSMEKNLTVLFNRVEELVHEKYPTTKGVFIAVSRAGIEVKEGGMYEKFKVFADSNLETMNRVVGDGRGSHGQGLGHGNVAVFECGRLLMDQYYKDHPESINYGQLLQSMMNFFIATESTVFVGVRGSSYSTDIWTTRFHQGKGAQNYEYTLDGIQLMENGGLPPPHKNCAKKMK